MSRLLNHLEINVTQQTLTYRDIKIVVSTKWIEVFALLGITKLEQRPPVTSRQICALPSWRSDKSQGVSGQVTRKFQTFAVAEQWLVCLIKDGKANRFELNLKTVSEVRFDLSIEQLREKLLLNSPMAFTIPYNVDLGSVVSAEFLASALCWLEQGRFEQCLQSCAAVLGASPTPNQQMMALSLRAWALILTDVEKATAVIGDMASHLENHAAQKDKSQIQYNLAPRFQALLPITQGRYHNRTQHFKQARAAFSEAKKLLQPEDHREWAAVEAGFGYIAQRTGNYEAAKTHYAKALTYASSAYWSWSIQIQYSNLSCVCFELYEQYRHNEPKIAMSNLDEALTWCHRSLNLYPVQLAGGSLDNELNLAFGYREKGDLSAAEYWINVAFDLARAANADSDLALCYAERAELQLARGNKQEGIEDWQMSIRYLKQAGLAVWRQQAQKRLSGLLSDDPSEPVKLW
jgi:tetratricopeptide (TPR) repeat protein